MPPRLLSGRRVRLHGTLLFAQAFADRPPPSTHPTAYQHPWPAHETYRPFTCKAVPSATHADSTQHRHFSLLLTHAMLIGPIQKDHESKRASGLVDDCHHDKYRSVAESGVSCLNCYCALYFGVDRCGRSRARTSCDTMQPAVHPAVIAARCHLLRYLNTFQFALFEQQRTETRTS